MPYTDPLKEYLDRYKVHRGPMTAEDEARYAEDGVIPVIARTAFPTEAVPIMLDTSRSQDAIRDLARAHVDAARYGSGVTKVSAKAANQRLLMDALGGSAMQFLTGVNNGSAGRSERLQVAAASGVDAYGQALTETNRIERTAGAEAEVQASRMADETQAKNQQEGERVRLYNDGIRVERELAETEAERARIDAAVAERKGDIEADRLMERQRTSGRNQLTANAALRAEERRHQMDSTVNYVRTVGEQMREIGMEFDATADLVRRLQQHEANGTAPTAQEAAEAQRIASVYGSMDPEKKDFIEKMFEERMNAENGGAHLLLQAVNVGVEVLRKEYDSMYRDYNRYYRTLPVAEQNRIGAARRIGSYGIQAAREEATDEDKKGENTGTNNPNPPAEVKAQPKPAVKPKPSGGAGVPTLGDSIITPPPNPSRARADSIETSIFSKKAGEIEQDAQSRARSRLHTLGWGNK